jgi:uncharacterized protein YjbI with pentapeptide repeats
MEKTNISSQELIKILEQGNPISNYCIIDDCTIDGSFPKDIRFENCSFQNLFIDSSEKIDFLSFKKCSFTECSVSGEINKIIFEEIEDTSKLQFSHYKIEFLRIEKSKISSVGFAIIDSTQQFIKESLIIENEINFLSLSGTFGDINVLGNIIHQLLCFGKIKCLNATNKNFRGDHIPNSKIGTISIMAAEFSKYNFFSCREKQKLDIGEIIFSGNSQNTEIKIIDCLINKLSFLNTFENQSLIYIANSTINDALRFNHCKVPDLSLNILDLRKTKFLLIDSTLSDIHWSNVNWPNENRLYKSEFHILRYSHVETIRQLKLKAIQQEDVLNKVKFASLEYSAIYETIRGEKWNAQKKWWKWLVNPFLDFGLIFKPDIEISTGDKLILFMNRYSNNFGLDWLRGILFTLSIGFIFFYFYLINIDNVVLVWKYSGNCEYIKSAKSLLPYYLEFLYAGHSFDFMKTDGFKLNEYAIIFDLLGRVFVGYGYYQIIRAFRKFSK